MTPEFEEWLGKWIKSHGIDFNPKGFNLFPFEMQTGLFQKYFWSEHRIWVNVQPYTDKFKGVIEKFWKDLDIQRHYITNNPDQAWKLIIQEAFDYINRK